jgi:acetyl-CoA carboxylase carboxyl transferase subunit alpha
LTAQDLKGFGVVDEILPEPAGGAHVDPVAMTDTVAAAIRRHLRPLRKLKAEALTTRRYKKFRAMGMVAHH